MDFFVGLRAFVKQFQAICVKDDESLNRVLRLFEQDFRLGKTSLTASTMQYECLLFSLVAIFVFSRLRGDRKFGKLSSSELVIADLVFLLKVVHQLR